MGDAWAELSAKLRELKTLESIGGLLGWDERTYMPKGASEVRGRQSALMAVLAHERVVDPSIPDLLEALASDPDPMRQATIRALRRRHEAEVKVPTDLVRALSEARTAGYSAWLRAKAEDDFSLFAPALEEVIARYRERLSCFGPAEDLYDHALQAYDPGTKTKDIEPLFARLSARLGAFLQEIEADRPYEPVDWGLDEASELRVHHRVIRTLGFDMNCGRLDRTVHPFCSGHFPQDVRLTTDVGGVDPLEGLLSTIHECGHGLYDQGLPAHLYGTGLDKGAGMAVHESQSRFFENIIGRSRPFLTWLSRIIKEENPGFGPSAERLYREANGVRRSLRRIQADEVTYNLHIIIRFELEKQLLDGSLGVSDVREAWDEAYERTLGVRPASAVQGVMQDVHWSKGKFGYFPSYALGNLYAASLGAAMEAQLPQMWDQVEQGDFSEILGWLRRAVHQRGSEADGPEIIADAVGERDGVEDLITYFRGRHGALFPAA